MTPPSVDAYLKQLRRELRRQFIIDKRIIDEVRGHLDDAIDRERERGTSPGSAESRAIQDFGAPELVAASFAADRTRILYRVLLAAATLMGGAIAYVDSRATWDDTGITAGAMALGAAALGLLGPRRPWLWGLAIGMWVPAYALVRKPGLGSLAMLVVLLFPLAGAYLGRTVRGLLH